MCFDQRKNVEENNYSVTANLFTFKDLFEQIGGFDQVLKSRGDREWGKRAASFGYPLQYASDVRVAHPARYSFAQLQKRMARLAGGFEDLEQKNRSLFTKQDRQEFSLSLVPSIQTFLRIWHSQLTVIQKVKVMFIGAAVKYIKIRERLRLKLWGKSTR